MPLRTCNHLYDTGGVCNSAAVTDRDYCAFHLRYRARQLRSAQARARMERFDLRLPPIESMASVLSAINQLVEAVAADMIDLKRADFLLKSLRFAAQALKSADKWLPSVYHSDVAAPAIDLAAEYGLPDDLDPNTPPEVAFPPTDARTKDGCPVQAGVACAGVFPHGAIHSLPLSIDCPTLASVAEVGRLPEIEFRPDSPVTPDMVEVIEISRTEGADAAALRGNQLELNRRRRRQRADRKRYAAIAVQQNIRQAAEKLAARKTMGGPQLPAVGNCGDASTQNSEVGCPIPPSVGGVGISPDTTKKPAGSVATTGETFAPRKEATTA